MAIHIKPKNRGKFTAYKKRTGKTTAECLHSKSVSVRKMANFARNAKKWKHGEGGLIEFGTNNRMQKNKINIDSLFNANKKVPFVNKIYDRDTASIQIPGVGGRSTHYMEQADNFIYPTVQNVNGAMQYLGDKAYDNALKTGNYIQLNNEEDAKWVSKNFKNSKIWKKYSDGDKNEYAKGGFYIKLENKGGYLFPELEYGGISINNLNIPTLAGSTPDVLAPTNNSFTPFQNNMKSGNINAGRAISGVIGLGTQIASAFAKPDEIVDDRVEVDPLNSLVQGASSGASLGSSLLGPVGGIGGAIIGGGLGMIAGDRKQTRLQRQLDKQNAIKLRSNQVKNRLSVPDTTPGYTPVARQGGFTVYKGQTHDGPDGGILTDEMGNPSGLSNNKPIALTEKNEVARYEPGTGSTYIYSDALGFARPATHLVNKYKLNKDNSLYKYDLLLRTAVDKQFDNLTQAQEFAKETKTSGRDALGIFKNGGQLSSAKAKEMLRDGTAHGKKLTPRQKRYFGWIAGGRKAEGGLLTSTDRSREILVPIANKEYDQNLRINPTWASDINTAGSINDVYGANVGTWKGQPLKMEEFMGFPDYVKNYYNPNLVVERQKKRFGLENTFDQLNKQMSPGNINTNLYNPSYNIRNAGNRIAYYDRGGLLPMYQDGDYLKYPKGFTTNDPEELKAYQTWLRQQKSITKTQRRMGQAEQPVFPDIYINYNRGIPGLYSTTPTTNITTSNKNIPTTTPSGYGHILPEVTIRPEVTKTGTGVGKPKGITRVSPINPLELPRSNWRDMYIKSLIDNSSLAGAPKTSDINAQEEEYNPTLSPLGHILSGVGSLADYAALKKAKPKNVSLGRVGAERISLAKQRLVNRRNADLARATASSSARALGTNAGTTLANVTTANTGVNRLLGQQNAQLLEQEENANAQMRQQASMVNAELSAQESLFNTQRSDAYNMLRARMNPAGGLARTAAGYFADNASYGRDYDLAQMYAPNADLVRDPNSTWVQRNLLNRGYKLRYK